MKIIILLISCVQIIMAKICIFTEYKKKGFFRLTMILKLSQIDIAIFKVFWICKFGKDVRIFAKYDCNSCFVNSFDSDQF